MAKKVTIEISDDIDGSQADQTVPFGLDGAAYEIDLSNSNADALRATLEPFVAVARRTRRTPDQGRSRPGDRHHERRTPGSSRLHCNPRHPLMGAEQRIRSSRPGPNPGFGRRRIHRIPNNRRAEDLPQTGISTQASATNHA